MVEMYSYKLDKFHQVKKLVHEDHSDEASILMSDFVYLPYIQIGKNDMKESEIINYLIVENNETTLEKMSKYFSIEINIQIRRKNGTINLIHPFKLCMGDDFKKMNMN